MKKNGIALLMILVIFAGGYLGPELLLNQMRSRTLDEKGVIEVSVDQVRPYGEEAVERVEHLEKLALFMDDSLTGEGNTLEWKAEKWTADQTALYRDASEQIRKGENMPFTCRWPEESGGWMPEDQGLILTGTQDSGIWLGVMAYDVESEDLWDSSIFFDLKTGMPLLLRMKGELEDLDSETLWGQTLLYYSGITGMEFRSAECSSDFLNGLYQEGFLEDMMLDVSVEDSEKGWDAATEVEEETWKTVRHFYSAITSDRSFCLLVYTVENPVAGDLTVTAGLFGSKTADILGLQRM